jgi:hypothetical protein
VILETLRAQCRAAGLSGAEEQGLSNEVSAVIAALMQNGRKVASANGQFSASREIMTDSAKVVVDARFGIRPGFLRRVVGAISRRAST